MGRIMRLFVAVISVFVVTVASAFAQPQLLRSVVASGGTVASPSLDGSVSLSSTVGQAVIFTQSQVSGASIHQGFWVPLDFGIVGVDEEGGDAIAGDMSNYPNPFSSSTTIRFTVPMDGRVTLRVFNLIGILVRTIVTDVSAAGSQEIAFYAVDDLGAPLAAGTYMYEVEGTTASNTVFRRMQRLNILR